jgi:DNA-binding NarL/FixJ family response regulator
VGRLLTGELGGADGARIAGYGHTVTGTIEARRRGRSEVVRLVHRGLGAQEFARAAARAVKRAVPCEGVCLLTLDPATLLPTAEHVENGLPAEATVRLTEIELGEPDFNKFTALARRQQVAASLSEATAGDLDLSLRQRELRRPSGFDDELRVVLSGGGGTWGALTLLREAGSPRFTPAEMRFLASVADDLGDGLRRAALLRGAVLDDASETGLVVLAPDGTVEMTNAAADRWLDALGAEHESGHSLPVVVRAVAWRARTLTAAAAAAAAETDGQDTGARAATARVRARTGQWLVVRASLLGAEPADRVAVLLEAARPPELAPLIAAAYGFTDRERRITELIARGYPTIVIAGQLHLSAYTVQDHLKSIFSKTGTSSRGDLVARIFFDHYAPRLTSPATPE